LTLGTAGEGLRRGEVIFVSDKTSSCPTWEHIRLLRAGDPGCDPAAAPGVALLTLEEPPHNLLTRALMADLAAAVEYVGRDLSIRALVLAGAGDGAFSAGADLAELVDLDVMDATAYALAGQEVTTALAALPVPLVAAISGECLGAGLELALACDLRVAGGDAVLGMGQVVGQGVSPGWGGTQRLARLVGPARAKELVFTGAQLAADKAAAWGLVDRVAPAGAHVAVALELAERIAAGAPMAMAAAKEAIDQGCEVALDEGLRLEAALFGRLFASGDLADRLRAAQRRR